MGKTGKISVIPKDANNAFPTMDTSLRQKGYSRVPGTVKMMLPYMEAGGKFRTGLDENAKNILAIEDKVERTRKQKEIVELRKRLEAELGGIDLSPTSKYYTSKVHAVNGVPVNVVHVEPYSLKDGDNLFNLDVAEQYVTYLWIKSHPTIASSIEAYYRGEYPPETQFFVNDEDVTADIEYSKKKKVNDAIVKFSSFSVEKRKKVARLLGLPVSDDTKETVVYNDVDNYLKAPEVRVNHFKGQDPIRTFGLYADMDDGDIAVRDTIEQAIILQIYRISTGGKIFEGEQQVFMDKDDMIAHFSSDKHQEDLLHLEKKISLKKANRV